ncbi:MAG: hypothetical protein AAB296_01085, partial [Candidatus Desantisbacteria bacterium]
MYKKLLVVILAVFLWIPVYAQQPYLPNIYQNIIKSGEMKKGLVEEQSFNQQLLRAKEGLSILLSDLEEDIKLGKDTTIRKKAIAAQLKVIKAIERETRKGVMSQVKASLFNPQREDISLETLENDITQVLTTLNVNQIRQLKQKLPAKPMPSQPIYHKLATRVFGKDKVENRLPQMLPRCSDRKEIRGSSAPALLSTTSEIQINQEIQDLAASLNNNYQEIFNWVQKNIDFQPYLGCAKGSILTLWDRAGNSADINALFCALLQAAGYTTNYIDASIIIPVEKAPNIAGVPDINDACNILNAHELIEGLIGSPTVTHLIISHFYTAVETGSGTICLDPGWKNYSFTPGIDVPYQTFEETGYLANEKAYLPVDKHEMQVKDWLTQNHPGTTIDDVYTMATISTTQEPQPPLPYGIYQIYGTYTAMPDWAIHMVGMKLVYQYADGAEETIIPRQTYNLCDLAGKRISLSNEPYQTNYYTPKIAVDGVVTQTSNYIFDPGTPLHWIIDFKALGHQGNPVCDHPWQTGATAVIALSPQAVSNRLIEERQSILMANRDNPQIAQEELLHLIVLGYFKDRDNSWHKACGLNHYPHTRATFEAMGIQSIGVDGNNVIPTSMAIDVLRVPQDVFNVEDVENFSALLGWQGSGEEHNIWEKLMEIPSISTTKGMQAAHQRNYTIYEVNSGNINTLLPLINIPQYKKDFITQLVNNGNTVTVPDHEFYYNDWYGIIIFAKGGAGAGYLIWGETQEILNGGQTTYNYNHEKTPGGKDANKHTTKDDPIDVA